MRSPNAFCTISEPLCEDEEFKDRELACVVASKVFYHLENLDLALTYALGAGNLFDLNERTEYVNTLVCKSCLALALGHSFLRFN